MEFDRDQLVQALGLSFTVSTITLAAALAYTGHVQTSLFPSIVALVVACRDGLGTTHARQNQSEPLAVLCRLMLLGSI
jgi:hypothetical protein